MFDRGSWYVMKREHQEIIASEEAHSTLEEKGWFVMWKRPSFMSAWGLTPNAEQVQISTLENDFISGEGKCFWCGEPAYYIEINFEVPVCSDRCVNALNNEYHACGGE